jgi:hypothetical protein
MLRGVTLPERLVIRPQPHGDLARRLGVSSDQPFRSLKLPRCQHRPFSRVISTASHSIIFVHLPSAHRSEMGRLLFQASVGQEAAS